MVVREALPRRILNSDISGVPLWLWIFYVVVSGLAILFYASFWPEAPVTDPDSPGYMEVARDLLDLRLDRAHLRPIGYPLLLMLTHSAHEPTRLLFMVQLILHILSVGLLLTVIGKVKGLGKASILFFMLLLFLPSFVNPAAYVLTENLSRFALVLGVVGLLHWFDSRRWFWLILSLLGFTYSGLVHSIYTFLPLVIVVALLAVKSFLPWSNLKWREVIIPVIGLTLFWFLVYRTPMLSKYLGTMSSGAVQGSLITSLGASFSSKTVKVLERLPDEYAVVRKVLIEERNYDLIHGESHTAASYMNRAIKRVSEVTGLKDKALWEYIAKLNWILIMKAPLHFLQEVLATMTYFWLPSAGEMASKGKTALKAIWSLIYSGIFIMLWLQIALLSSVTILLKRRRFVALRRIPSLKEIKLRTLGYAVCWFIILYVWFVSCVIGMGTVRYRQPIETLMLFACFWGFVMMRETISPLNHRHPSR